MEAQRVGSNRILAPLLTGIILLTIALAALAWVLTRAPSPRQVRLNNGQILKVYAANYGPGEQVQGSPWQRFLYQVLPVSEKHRSGVRVFEGGNPGELVLWTDQLREPSGYPGVSAIRAVPLDEHGCMGPAHERQSIYALSRWSFAAFPRRGKQVGMRLFVAGPNQTWQPLGEVLLPNPVRKAPEVWSAAPLPQSASTGNLKVILTELKTGVRRPEGRSYSWQMLHDEWAQLRLQVLENGKPAPWWSASVSEVRDATGNRWSPPASTTRREGDGQLTYFQAYPWPDEKSWRLRLRLARTPEAAFTPAELWTVRGIPLLPARTRKPFRRAVTLNGVRLATLEALGPDARPPAPLNFGVSERKPALAVRFQNFDHRTHERFLLRATDDRGRPVTPSATHTAIAREIDELITLEAQPGARSVDLTFAIQQPRYVEITADKHDPRP